MTTQEPKTEAEYRSEALNALHALFIAVDYEVAKSVNESVMDYIRFLEKKCQGSTVGDQALHEAQSKMQ